MRKIVSRQEENKRKKRNQFIVGGVLMLVMLISVLGYAFQGQITTNQTTTTSSNTTTYNGIVFTYQNGFWTTTYNNQQLIFTFTPVQINSDLTNLTENINNLSDKPIYLYSEDPNAESELSINLAKFVSQIILVQNLSTIDCSSNTIIVQNNPSYSVKQNQNCIIISGEGQDLIGTVDNVLFKMFGIKQ
jgi:hypothetical protein